MVAQRKPVTPAAIDPVDSPRNGLEPTRLERWICDGRRRDGGPCGAVLMELGLQSGRVRIRCSRCGTWHTRERP